ncbi:MAG: hypothetical protein Kow0063_19960 [Anaerolineae bacterium]
MTNRKSQFCYLTLVLAWVLRLYQLNADSLWGDEIFSATQSPLPVMELLRWTAGDIHPPGYYLIVGRLSDWLGWAHLPPTALTDWLWRFPSGVVGTLAVAVTYRLGADLLGRWVGLAGALLLAVSPVAVQYSQEARMHELFLLGAVLSTWALSRALMEPGRRGWWLAYALATALSLYTVYLGFVVLAAQAGWVLARQIANRKSQITGDWGSCLEPVQVLAWPPGDQSPGYHTTPRERGLAGFIRRCFVARKFISGRWAGSVALVLNMSRDWTSLLGWLGSVVLALALYLPWWPTLLGIASRRLSAGGAENGVGVPLDFLIKGLYSLGPGPGWPAWLFLGLWVIGVLSLILRGDLGLALFAWLWLALPLALPFGFRDPRALHMRYVFLLPVYLLSVAQGALALGAWGWRLVAGGRGVRGLEDWGKRVIGRLFPDLSLAQLPYVAVILVLALVSALYLPGYYQRSKPDWRGAAAYLSARTIPGDVVVTGPLFDVGRYLDYYYAGPAELLPPAALVDTLHDRLDSMRASGGRVWVVTRFQPAPVAAMRRVQFSGVTVSEPLLPVYEPEVLEMAMIDLMQQAVAAAPDWAAQMAAQGVMSPDPLVARAAAYLFLGDVYRVAGRLPEAVAAYEAMLADYPASAGGYVILAEAYEAAGQPEAAVGAYRRAVALNPYWQGPGVEEAESLANAGRWAEAAAAYQAIVR